MDALKMSRTVLPHRRLLPLDERLEHAAARPVIIPETIVCDRGKAFISENLRSACRTLEISFQPCHPRSPAEKPHIERTLGSVATLFCQFLPRLPGPHGRTPRSARRGRAALVDAGNPGISGRMACHHVAKQAPRRTQDPGSPGQTFTPNEKYASLIESAGYVPLAFAGDDYVELLPATWRAVDSYGVKINHRVHDCAELGPLRRRPSGVTRKKNLWEIHRDPYDANWIWVRNHWEGGRIPVPWKHLGTVPQPFGDLAWDHAVADLRQRGESDPTEEQIARAVSELLVRARQGPDSGGKNRASRRDRRVAARTRAAAEGTGPQPPKPGPVPTGTDAHGLATTRKGATRRTNRSRRSSRSVSSIPSRRLTNDGDRNGALAQLAAGPGTAAPMATGPGPRGTAPLPHHPGRLAGVRRPGSGPPDLLPDHLGLPVTSRANITDVIEAVCGVLNDARVSVVCVDELHNLSLATRNGAEVSDTLKYFSERIPATFIYASVDLEANGLFDGTRGRQIAGRFGVIETVAFPRTEEWTGLVTTLEQALRLHHHRSGTLEGLAHYLHERTGGMIGCLSHLIRGAAIDAILDSTEKITRKSLQNVKLDRAAQNRKIRPAS
ncbi:hypothetical protein ABT144_14305 [Streptomyces sp. NPDC002039]|uniref:hypothetical protein n=1 Tax=Streptomyces sp. NPDC002039 TaxID=3154660 RepID=UPI0033303694